MRHLLALGLLVSPVFQAAIVAPDPVQDVVGGPCATPGDTVAGGSSKGLSGDWLLSWDDSVDLTLDDGGGKACRLALQEVHGAVVGRFDGPVLGRERLAIFTGEVLPVGPAPVVLLVQREEDYTCTYQLTRESPTRLCGTWRDSRGEGGTVFLTADRPPAPGMPDGVFVTAE